MMLVGEAAGVDPATGEGIAQAIEYGVLAGRFLASCLRTDRPRPTAVDDWTARVASSRLGRDLRVRTRLLRLFFGPGRRPLERLLTRSPHLLHVGCQHFAAQPLDPARVARLAFQTLSCLW
jgi:flavin-dependent dehydrogenase